MAPGRRQELGPARFVYATCFGCHQCGGVPQLGGRKARGHWCARRRSGCSTEKPWDAGAAAPGGGRLPRGTAPWAPAAAAAASGAAASPRRRASRARSRPRPAARAGLIQKNVSKQYDFPVSLNGASKIMKKKKKEVSVWNGVYKFICRMLEENEKYRLRLNSKRLSSEHSDCTR